MRSGTTDRQTDGQTDRQTPLKILPPQQPSAWLKHVRIANDVPKTDWSTRWDRGCRREVRELKNYVGVYTAVTKTSEFCRNVVTASDRRRCRVSATSSMLYGASNFSDKCSSSSDHNNNPLTATIQTSNLVQVDSPHSRSHRLIQQPFRRPKNYKLVFLIVQCRGRGTSRTAVSSFSKFYYHFSLLQL